MSVDPKWVGVGLAVLAIGFARTGAACGGATDTELNTSPDASGSTTPPTGARGPTGSVVEDGGVRAPGSSAAPGGSTTSLPCGAATCVLPGEVCCASEGGNGTFTFACVAGTTCPQPTANNGEADLVTLACSSSANCAAGTVCCIAESGGDKAITSCKTACAKGEGQLCDPKAPAGCPSNTTCSSKQASEWNLPSAFGVCVGR